MADTIKIKQVRSANGVQRKQRATLLSLGLGKVGRTVERPDDPTVRGAVHAIRHLVQVED